MKPQLFLCSGSDLPSQLRHKSSKSKLSHLDSIGPKANVNIQLGNVARVLHTQAAPRAIDLLEIAAYVYAADCMVLRGRGWSNDGAEESWGRDFHFVVPVRDHGFWSKDELNNRISTVLSFLSDDKYTFTFVPLRRDRATQEYFDFGESETWPYLGIERVIMFSGGLDSLAGAIDYANSNDRYVLVSHRSQAHLSSRQKNLFAQFHNRWPHGIHVPVWINKSEHSYEPTQRTRSFLYSALGSLVAASLGSKGVRFYENGIVSLNLPVADEVVRARASRTTHPHALALFSKLYTEVLERPIEVDNPYLHFTKAQVVEKIVAANAGALIAQTCSCAHTIFKSRTRWHCGTCSQCIDRRFAILAADAQQFDNADDYESDVFVGPRKDGYERNMAINFVRHAMELKKMHELDFIERFGTEISRATRAFPDRDRQAEALWRLHKQHGEIVSSICERQIQQNAGALLSGGLPDSCLLTLVGSRKHLEPLWNKFADRVVNILRQSLPKAYRKTKPKNELELQSTIDSLLTAADQKLSSEYPFVQWGSRLAKPDWSIDRLNVFVEAKYIKDRGDIRRITEEIAADIVKYGDSGKNTLFLLYDPAHAVVDEDPFSAISGARPEVRLAFLR